MTPKITAKQGSKMNRDAPQLINDICSEEPFVS